MIDYYSSLLRFLATTARHNANNRVKDMELIAIVLPVFGLLLVLLLFNVVSVSVLLLDVLSVLELLSIALDVDGTVGVVLSAFNSTDNMMFT